mgnify:CR=1 FL=1
MSVSPLPESRPILSQMPSDPELERLSEVFKIFSDNSRLRIIAALLEKELCVYDLTQALGMTQSAVSHQLRLLKNLNAVTTRRQGKVIFYSLRNELLNDVLLKGVEFLGY